MDKKRKCVIVLGASSDIGAYVCRRYLEDGFRVLGTYRHFSKQVKALESAKGMMLLSCDVEKEKDIGRLVGFIKKNKFVWDTFFSAVGTTEPIGRFFELPFKKWEKTVHVNALGQLRLLHALHPYRAQQKTVDVVFLAGGGTNNPFRCYSAYCLGKIMLIKMCELLDDENTHLKVFIIGPGFVRTKTHQETLRAGKAAEGNYQKVQKWLQDKNAGTPMEDIYACIRWAQKQERRVVGGRNFSVVHDLWGEEELTRQLARDGDMYKLRRSKNDWSQGGTRHAEKR